MKRRKISCDVLILFRSLRFGARRSCWYISAGRHVASLEKWTLDEPVLEFPLHCRQVGWGSTALGALSPREACSVSLGLAQLPVGFPACFPACVITVRPLTACRTQSHKVPSLRNLRSCRRTSRSPLCPVVFLLPYLMLHLRYHCLYATMSPVVNSGALH